MALDDDKRPNPDALLIQTQAQEAAAKRGKLKIFFGASPGVGKTYAMLQEAKRLRAQGLDVVIGVVESHGRKETANLVEGLECLPMIQVEHRGRTLHEFDLDAALKRKPAILLVDELAHSNVIGSRHPKRWQDVEELLAAGINVLSTINVQHIESLNDVVGGITSVRVWETVPDKVFDEASEVVLVDLPPDDLLVRLKEGKVYLPEQAERAIQNFFRKGNLIALRELALRRTAERVDEDMRVVRREDATQRVWHTSDSLLVCVGPNLGDDKIVRTAARLSARLNSNWHAIYIETPESQRLPDDIRRALLASLKLAQDLGAETATIPAQQMPEAVIEYARQHNLGKIVIGRSAKEKRNRAKADKVLRVLGELAPELDFVVVAREDAERDKLKSASGVLFVDDLQNKVNYKNYLIAFLICVGVTIGAMPLLKYFDLANIVLLFLLGVVAAAMRGGRGPAVLAAIVSVILFDFFFVMPRFSFAVTDVQYILTFIVLLLVGLVVGQLTASLKFQVSAARTGERRARHLYEMAKMLSSALMEDQVEEIAIRFLQQSFSAKACLILPDEDEKLKIPSHNDALPNYDMAVAHWCFDKSEAAGLGTDTLPANHQLYLPLKAPMRTRGVLVIESENARPLIVPEQRRVLETFAALIAIALERVHFVSVAQESLLRIESERLRNSILAALSHDLRTPMTALVGLAETLMMELQPEQKEIKIKINAIRDHAFRTSRLVNNLLETAKLQSGAMKIRKDWQSFQEILGAALKSLEPIVDNYPVEIQFPDNLPLVRCDATLIERVLSNLIENAMKYSAPGSVINIAAVVDVDALKIEVSDVGSGIPSGQEREIFEKFVRGQRESSIAGVGLGLAICEAIILAHNGKIWAENKPDKGAKFTFTLPLERQPSVD